MRTTVTIDDKLLRQARIIAAKRGDSLKSIVEEGLREVIRLHTGQKNDRRPPLVIHKTGGARPGIDLDKTSQLLASMDAWDATN